MLRAGLVGRSSRRIGVIGAAAFAALEAATACSSESAPSPSPASESEADASDGGVAGNDQAAVDTTPLCSVAATPGTGPEDRREAYWGRCSPRCGEGQFCFSFGVASVDYGVVPVDPADASIQRPASDDWVNARPLYCNGCHPMPECDGADPCTCLLETLPEDVCGGAPVQCRAWDAGTQFRCMAVPWVR